MHFAIGTEQSLGLGQWHHDHPELEHSGGFAHVLHGGNRDSFRSFEHRLDDSLQYIVRHHAGRGHVLRPRAGKQRLRNKRQFHRRFVYHRVNATSRSCSDAGGPTRIANTDTRRLEIHLLP